MAAIGQAASAPEYSLKLFGMKISLPDPSADDRKRAAGIVEVPDLPVAKICRNSTPQEEEDGSNAESGSGNEEGKRKRRRKQENEAVAASAASAVSGGAARKKPETPVACPRCQSMDTKFCYFNNYNVNQPRHFCKSCQRYWTAGGTLRNVPVGAGRRKSKHAAAAAARVQDSGRRDRGGGCAAAAAAGSSRSSSPSSGGAGSMSDDSQASSSREDCSSSSITQESKAWVGLPVDPAVAAAAAMIGGNWTGLVPWNAGMLVSPLATPSTRTRAMTTSQQQQGSGLLWVPKSQRIEESGEAAGGAASFLTSLASGATGGGGGGGGNKVPEGSIVAGGMFKAFHSKVQAPPASSNDGVGVHAVEEGDKVNSSAEEERVPTEEV